MRQYVFEKLKTLSIAKIKLDQTINEYLIPRYTKPQFNIGKMYLIRVSNEIVNNPNTILACNWNNGNYPRNNFYKVYISKIVGANVYADCLAIDPITKQDKSEIFSGYLDVNYIEQLEEL